jgi:hypothetical protein
MSSKIYNKHWASKMMMSGYTWAILKEQQKHFKKLLHISKVANGNVEITKMNYAWEEISQGEYNAISKFVGWAIVKILKNKEEIL